MYKSLNIKYSSPTGTVSGTRTGMTSPFRPNHPFLASQITPSHLSQSTIVAHDGENDLLPNSQRSRINSIVQAHNLPNSSSKSLRQIEESVSTLDRPRTNTLTERVRADRDVDNLTRENEIDVLNLRVDSNDRVEGNVERLANSPETIALTDIVGGSDTRDAGLGDFWGGSDAAGVVVGVSAVLWDNQSAAERDDIDVFDVVDGGDVADAGAVELSDAGEGVAFGNGVVDRAGRAANVEA